MRHLRRRDHRQLRQFALDRMKLKIVDQNGGSDHTGLGSRTAPADDREGCAVLHPLEQIGIVTGRKNVFQRSRGEAAESKPTYEFLMAIDIDAIDQQRQADRPGSLLGTRQRPELRDAPGRRIIHFADHYAVRLVPRSAELDQLLLQLSERHGVAGADEQVAYRRGRSAKTSREARPAVGALKASNRL